MSSVLAPHILHFLLTGDGSRRPCTPLFLLLPQSLPDCGDAGLPDILDSLCNRQPLIHRLRRQARKVKGLLGCLRLEAVFADEAAVLVHLKVDVIHANDACHVILMAAWRSRVSAVFSPSERTCRHGSIVVVSKGVSAEPFRHEPSWAVRLLSLHSEELQDHERDDEHGCIRLCLLVQEVVLVNLEVQGHKALRGEQGNTELK